MIKPTRKPMGAMTNERAARWEPAAERKPAPGLSLTRRLATGALLLSLVALAIAAQGCGRSETYGEPVTAE